MEALHIHYSVQETECCKVSRDLWVIAQHELTLDYRGSDKKPTALSPPLSTRFFLSPWPLRPSARKPHREPEIVSQLRCGQTAGAGCAVWLQTGWQTARPLLCHCGAWPGTAMPGGERVFPVLRPSWDRSGIYEENEGRNAAGGGGGGGGGGGEGLRGWLTCR